MTTSRYPPEHEDRLPPRFINPWAGVPGFVNLGHYDYTTLQGEVTQFDLYVLVSAAGDRIDIGARYSDTPEDYLSGSAQKRKDGTWRIMACSTLHIAAARYFANLCALLEGR